MKYKPTKQEIISGTVASSIAAVLIWVVGGVLACIWQLCTGEEFSFKGLFTLQIPLWLVLAVATVGAAVYLMRKTYKKPMPFLSVHEMTVGGFRWTWQWKYNEERKQYEIYNLKPYCPRCGSVLTCGLYQRPAYQCINGHGYDNVEWGKAGNEIADRLRSDFPDYRDMIWFAS